MAFVMAKSIAAIGMASDMTATIAAAVSTAGTATMATAIAAAVTVRGPGPEWFVIPPPRIKLGNRFLVHTFADASAICWQIASGYVPFLAPNLCGRFCPT